MLWEAGSGRKMRLGVGEGQGQISGPWIGRETCVILHGREDLSVFRIGAVPAIFVRLFIGEKLEVEMEVEAEKWWDQLRKDF